MENQGKIKKSYRRVSWHSHAPIRSGHRCVTVTSQGTGSIPPEPSSLRPPPPSFAKERVRGGIVRDSGCGGGESRCRVEGTQSGLQGARGGRTNPSPGGNNILPGRLRGFRARKSLSAGLSRRRETKRNKQGFYRRQGEELGSSGSGPGGSRVPSPPCSPVLPDVPPCPRRGKRRRPPAPRCAPAGLTRGVPVPSLPGPTFAVVPCPPPAPPPPPPSPGLTSHRGRQRSGARRGAHGAAMGSRAGAGGCGARRHREAPGGTGGSGTCPSAAPLTHFCPSMWPFT